MGSHYQIGVQVILFGRIVLFFKISCSSWLQIVPVHQFLLCNYGAKKYQFLFGGDGERSADQVIPDLAALREPERTKPQVCGQEKCSIFPLDRGIHLGNCMEW